MLDFKTLVTGSIFTLLSISLYTQAAESNQNSQSAITGFTLDVGYDEGAFYPKGTLPYYWNNHFSSSIALTGKQTLIIEDIFDENEESLNASIVQENRFAFSPIIYENNDSQFGYSLGIELEKIKLKAKDRGFYLDNNDAAQHFNIDRKITVNRMNIPLSLQYRTHYWTNRLNISVTPHASLDLEQSVLAPEFNSQTQSLKEKEGQDFAWKVSWEGIVKTSHAPFLMPGWHFGYEHLPLKYKGLSANSNIIEHPSGYETANYEDNTNTLRAELRLYTPSKNAGKMTRYISIAREKISTDFSVESSDGTIKGKDNFYRTVYSIGFDERF